MVLMGTEYEAGELADAVSALRTLAEHGGWAHLVRVVDGPEAAFAAIRDLVPPEVVVHRPALRKR
jgi:hypothetical protein